MWYGHKYGKEIAINLATVSEGHIYVMGCMRSGFQGAKPLFHDCGKEKFLPIDAFIEPDHNGKIVKINNPDAILIAAAPEMFNTLEGIVDSCDICQGGMVDMGDSEYAVCGYCGAARKLLEDIKNRYAPYHRQKNKRS